MGEDGTEGECMGERREGEAGGGTYCHRDIQAAARVMVVM